MLDKILGSIRRYLPKKLFAFFQPFYHQILAFIAAVIYGFPSRKIKVIAVTGTKGKSSTVEIINSIFEEVGKKTALSNTIRFKVGNDSRSNLYKMSMPGRFFVQKLLREAVLKGCEYMIMEMTSQGSLLFRHNHIELDALVVTNISPEHIEAHGSYENYVNAKVEIAKALSASKKPSRIIIVNKDDREKDRFLACKADRHITYSISDLAPYEIRDSGLSFTLNSRPVSSPLSGLFNLSNIAAAIAAAHSQGIDDAHIISALQKFSSIPGRVQKIEAGQDFSVIVDYAHTADSLKKIYSHFHPARKICVLGGTGGGRDSWKRKEMGKLADEYCSEIVLTDEDPYDENPRQIVNDVASGITSKSPRIIMDRRKAIREAIKLAKKGDVILITGKGTDPYIMGPKESKIPWSDAKVAEEELINFLKNGR